MTNKYIVTKKDLLSFGHDCVDDTDGQLVSAITNDFIQMKRAITKRDIQIIFNSLNFALQVVPENDSHICLETSQTQILRLLGY